MSRAKRALQAGPAPDGAGVVHVLLTASRAVLAAFGRQIDDGVLGRSQHASLRLLEEALSPFNETDPGGPTDPERDRPLGPTLASHGQSESADPAADETGRPA